MHCLNITNQIFFLLQITSVSVVSRLHSPNQRTHCGNGAEPTYPDGYLNEIPGRRRWTRPRGPDSGTLDEPRDDRPFNKCVAVAPIKYVGFSLVANGPVRSTPPPYTASRPSNRDNLGCCTHPHQLHASQSHATRTAGAGNTGRHISLYSMCHTQRTSADDSRGMRLHREKRFGWGLLTPVSVGPRSGSSSSARKSHTRQTVAQRQQSGIYLIQVLDRHCLSIKCRGDNAGMTQNVPCPSQRMMY